MATRTPIRVDNSLNRSEIASSKRIRLSLACNQCRKRKVRCDTDKPKCRNCLLRNEICETTDPRYPGSGLTERRLATKDGFLAGQSPVPTDHTQTGMPRENPIAIPVTAQASFDKEPGIVGINSSVPAGWSNSVPISTVVRYSDGVSTSPAGTLATVGNSTPLGTVPWVTGGYDTNTSAEVREEVNINDNSPDLAVNRDSSNSNRLKYMGGSSLQCLSAFVNVYLRRKGLQTISSHFRSGMRHIEEFQLSLTTLIPSLPTKQAIGAHLDTFFMRMWPLYPVVDRRTVEASVDFFHRSESLSQNGLQATLTSPYVPQLVIVFSIIAIAADEAAGTPTELGHLYLDAAYNLFAHLVATPYLTSVQALLLLAVALRCRFKDGQAWHVLAQAIRVAHSLGLHRYIRLESRSTAAVASENPPGSYQTDFESQGRVWWSCYALEKLMELETGRPSAINDEDIDQILPPDSLPVEDRPDLFSLWVRLARILGRISKRLYKQKPPSAAQLMFEIGRLDQQLLEWAATVPNSIKPEHELFAGYDLGQVPYQQHVSSFLSLQYYQAQITLHRAALVFPSQSFINEVKRLGPGLPSYVRLLQSEKICTGAARATVRQVLELADHDIHSLIFSGTQLFLATIVLALYIVKSLGKPLIRADLELLISATEHLEAQFRHGGQHPDFIRGFETLRTSVQAVANAEQLARLERLRQTLDTRPEGDIPAENRDALSPFEDPSLLFPGLTPDPISGGLSDDIPFEELWGAMGNYSLLEPILDDTPFQLP